MSASVKNVVEITFMYPIIKVFPRVVLPIL